MATSDETTDSESTPSRGRAVAVVIIVLAVIGVIIAAVMLSRPKTNTTTGTGTGSGTGTGTSTTTTGTSTGTATGTTAAAEEWNYVGCYIHLTAADPPGFTTPYETWTPTTADPLPSLLARAKGAYPNIKYAAFSVPTPSSDTTIPVRVWYSTASTISPLTTSWKRISADNDHACSVVRGSAAKNGCHVESAYPGCADLTRHGAVAANQGRTWTIYSLVQPVYQGCYFHPSAADPPGFDIPMSTWTPSATDRLPTVLARAKGFYPTIKFAALSVPTPSTDTTIPVSIWYSTAATITATSSTWKKIADSDQACSVVRGTSAKNGCYVESAYPGCADMTRHGAAAANQGRTWTIYSVP